MNYEDAMTQDPRSERAQLSDERIIEAGYMHTVETDEPLFQFDREELIAMVRELIAADRATAPVSVAEPVANDDPEVDPVKALCYYADSMCGILRQHGYPGKAEALESRIRVVMDNYLPEEPVTPSEFEEEYPVTAAMQTAVKLMLDALAATTQGADDARPVAIKRVRFPDLSEELYEHYVQMSAQTHAAEVKAYAKSVLATRDAAPSDAKRLKQLEHALVYVAHSMHSEPQYMLAEGITLGDVSFVRVKVADIDVSVDLPESVARAMYEAARHAIATKDAERRIAIAPKEKT